MLSDNDYFDYDDGINENLICGDESDEDRDGELSTLIRDVYKDGDDICDQVLDKIILNEH